MARWFQSGTEISQIRDGDRALVDERLGLGRVSRQSNQLISLSWQ
jgi:hypothetical protein